MPDDEDDDFVMTCESCGCKGDFQEFAHGDDDGSHSYRCPECGESVGD